MNLLVQALAVVAALVGLPRWLRVAQREHYVAGSVRWLQGLWLARSVPSLVVQAVATVLLVMGLFTTPWLLVGAAVVAQLPPFGLPWRGRTSPLAWTARLRRLAAATVLLLLLLALVGLAPLAAVFLPVTVDAALWLTGKLEARLSRTYVVQAEERIAKVRPTVVAITGSFGKTTTKNYLAHLLAGSHAVLASPASFNNAMGLSKAVNDALVPGTEVFVAEMGTYGPGEIRGLCRTFPPDVAVLTAIGEVHLQRMKDRQGVLTAKEEITERARTVVLNADDDLLQGLAVRCEQQGKTVVRCSLSDPTADVALLDGHLHVRGEDLGPVELPESVHASGVACALGAALALGDDLSLLVRRLPTIPSVAHRLEAVAQPGGSWILDDTYNSNPVGAAEAVRRARLLADRSGGRVHVVTPGMVELGSLQAQRNTELAQAVAAAGAATLVVVGRTNGAALVAGAEGTATEVVRVPTREVGVAEIGRRSAPGDVVLFENDLPDHYP